MVKVSEKMILWVTLVAVLFMGFAESSELDSLKPRSEQIAISGPSMPPPHPRPVFGTLPKGPVPPSGPSKPSPVGDPISRSGLRNFGMLPKGPVPPSGPSKPSPSKSRPNFGMLPKGVPIPPSGPSHRTTSPPPPPPPSYK